MGWDGVYTRPALGLQPCGCLCSFTPLRSILSHSPQHACTHYTLGSYRSSLTSLLLPVRSLGPFPPGLCPTLSHSHHGLTVPYTRSLHSLPPVSGPILYTRAPFVHSLRSLTHATLRFSAACFLLWWQGTGGRLGYGVGMVLVVPGVSAHTPTPYTPPTIRALFSTVSPLSSHEVDGVRKEKERLTDGRSW